MDSMSTSSVCELVRLCQVWCVEDSNNSNTRTLPSNRASTTCLLIYTLIRTHNVVEIFNGELWKAESNEILFARLNQSMKPTQQQIYHTCRP